MNRPYGPASRPERLLALVLLLTASCGPGGLETASGDQPEPSTPPAVQASDAVEAGRYLVEIGGCNDCHTDGYSQSGGAIPESERLTGSVVGMRGPWGTTWPANLRLTADRLTEDAWVEMVSTRTTLPPMPWLAMNAMSEADQRAIHRYLRSLGPAGEPAPTAIGPEQEPATPWILFVPQEPVSAGR
ncbi:MAG: cytochrome C [Gemmatimonadota bacterium]|jgi:mono/diheme cytochrome c family protein